eukprot:763193-Hanusia_phi.AAC.6
MLVVFQSDVEVANLIDDSIRNNLLQQVVHILCHHIVPSFTVYCLQDDALASVRTHGDFFDYLLKSFDNKLQNFVDGSEPTGGLINTILGGTWYNGDPFTTNEMGMIYNYNKLIGGVLIIQKRGEIEACEYSMYSLFYPTCYSRVKYITADPPLRANGTQEVCGSSVPMMEIDESSADYQQYLDELESSKFGDRTKLNQTDYLNVASSFQYSYKDQGYRVWLSLADGIKANLQQIEQLQELKWLDSKTRHIDLKFIFYNGNFGMFTFAKALDEHIPDPEVNEEELRKEMSEIDAEIDRLNKRKNYIEKTLDAPLVEQPCHDVWNKKRCSFDELVGVIHKMYPNLHYDIDDMQHAWSRSVYKVSAGTEEQVDWKTEMLEKYLQQIQAENQRLQSKLSLTT